MKKITLKEIKSTCAAAACPSIYKIEGEEKQLVLVGKKLDPRELEGVSINKNEAAVMVDKEMIKTLKKTKEVAK